MKEKNKRIVEELKKLDIYDIYHANSVLSSMTFIDNNGLMPKGLISDLHMQFAEQESDRNDKKVNIFYDIFFDTMDAHSEFNNVNDYGPVLFIFNVDVLSALENSEVKVTRINPVFWQENMTEEEKYLSVDEIATHMKKGDNNNQIAIKNFNDILNFDYLKEIIIDDPGIENELLLKNALTQLKKRLDKQGIEKPFNIRDCSHCGCKEKYCNMRYAYHHFKTRM